MRLDGDRSSIETGTLGESLNPPGIAPVRLQIVDSNTVILPNGQVLADALYVRVGDNLVIRSADGEI